MAKCVACQLNVVEEPHEKVPTVEEIRKSLSRLEEEKDEEETKR